MLNNKKRWFLVRAGENAKEAGAFLKHEVAALGFDIGPIRPDATMESLRLEINRVYPQVSNQGKGSFASMLLGFSQHIQPGDIVVTYDAESRRYVFGSVYGPYRHESSVIEGMDHLRTVRWSHMVAKSKLEPLRGSLRSIRAFCQLSDDTTEKLMALAEPLPTSSSRIQGFPGEDIINDVNRLVASLEDVAEATRNVARGLRDEWLRLVAQVAAR